MKKLNGVTTPQHKGTANSVPKHIPTPAEVIIPMSMHIGASAKPVVKPGDTVKVGQLIGEATGALSSPVYASVSGTVKKISEIDHPSGYCTTAVFIEANGLQTPFEGVTPPRVKTLEEFLRAVRESGVVGLGGACFPTEVKLAGQHKVPVEYLIINGAECEPYITSDTRTMIDDKDNVWEGVLLLRKYLNPQKVLIAIEDNKPQCIHNFKDLAARTSGVEIRVLPSLYPQGGEKVLIYHMTGKILPEGKLPIDVGVLVINCTTLAAINKYLKTGMPLVEKCITVEGSAVKEPQNVIAPIGTPLRDVFAFCGGYRTKPGKILYGGPMMGIAVPNDDVPLLKGTNAVLAFNEKEAKLPPETACIRCGRCIEHCPMQLTPVFIENAYQCKRPDLLEKYKVNLCMECGCCSFICPAKRPLVQVMKLAKTMLWEYQNEQKLQKENMEANSKELAATL